MPSPHPRTDVGLHQQLRWLGVTSFEISWIPQQVSSGKPHCHLRSLFPGPPPTKKYQVSKKYGEYSSLPHMEDWRAWCHWGGWAARPRAIGSFPTQSLISLAPLGPPVQVSVVLFHPVPAFITVLPVLFSLNDLSVAPTEESHLSKNKYLSG